MILLGADLELRRNMLCRQLPLLDDDCCTNLLVRLLIGWRFADVLELTVNLRFLRMGFSLAIIQRLFLLYLT